MVCKAQFSEGSLSIKNKNQNSVQYYTFHPKLNLSTFLVFFDTNSYTSLFPTVTYMQLTPDIRQNINKTVVPGL